MDDLLSQHEDPTGDASRSAASYIALALAAAHKAIEGRTRRVDQGAGASDDLAAATATPEAKAAWAVMLGRDHGRHASSETTLHAWLTAQPLRAGNTDADLVAGRAEDRLRVLHPDAMARYDALRAGLDPVAAMREVAPLIRTEQQQQNAAQQAYAPLLNSSTAATADSTVALAAWQAAVPLRDTLPHAAAAATAAEGRLRQLHPEAIARFDTLQASSTPEQALAEVRPLLQPTASPAPGSALTAAAAPPAGVSSTANAGTVTAAAASVDQPPPPHVRLEPVVREVLHAELATAVLHDQAWPALAVALEQAQQAGAAPEVLLRDVAEQRELTSANNPAQVLHHRLTHRAATAADIAASSYPIPLVNAAATHRVDRPGPDLAALGAALELGRQADTETEHGRGQAASSTPDNPATPHVDEHADAAAAGQVHHHQAAADSTRASGLLDQANGAPASHTPPAPAAAAAAQSYPVALNQVPATQAATAAVRPSPGSGPVAVARPPAAAARRR